MLSRTCTALASCAIAFALVLGAGCPSEPQKQPPPPKTSHHAEPEPDDDTTTTPPPASAAGAYRLKLHDFPDAQRDSLVNALKGDQDFSAWTYMGGNQTVCQYRMNYTGQNLVSSVTKGLTKVGLQKPVNADEDETGKYVEVEFK